MDSQFFVKLELDSVTDCVSVIKAPYFAITSVEPDYSKVTHMGLIAVEFTCSICEQNLVAVGQTRQVWKLSLISYLLALQCLSLVCRVCFPLSSPNDSALYHLASLQRLQQFLAAHLA